MIHRLQPNEQRTRREYIKDNRGGCTRAQSNRDELQGEIEKQARADRGAAVAPRFLFNPFTYYCRTDPTLF